MYEDWIKLQKDYLNNLESWEISYLKQYTDGGHSLLRDVTLEFVTPFNWERFREKIARGEMNYYDDIFFNLSYLLRSHRIRPPKFLNKNFSVDNLKKWPSVFSNEDYKKAIMRIKSIIVNIIRRAPVTTQDMLLYRGTEDAYFVIQGTNEYSSPNIVSTSLSKRIALTFTKKETGCCLKIITVPEGTSALYIEPISEVEGEEEVLLLPDTKFIRQRDDDGKIYYMDISE